MAVYEYTAKDINGNKFSGVCNDIDNVAVLRNDLAKMGDTLLKAKRRKSNSSKRARITQDVFSGIVNNGMPRNARRADIESFIQANNFRYQAKYIGGSDVKSRIREIS